MPIGRLMGAIGVNFDWGDKPPGILASASSEVSDRIKAKSGRPRSGALAEVHRGCASYALAGKKGLLRGFGSVLIPDPRLCSEFFIPSDCQLPLLRRIQVLVKRTDEIARASCAGGWNLL